MDCLSDSTISRHNLSPDVYSWVQAQEMTPPSPVGACLVIWQEILGVVACRVKANVMAPCSVSALYRRSPFTKKIVDPPKPIFILSVTMVRMIYLASLQIIP